MIRRGLTVVGLAGIVLSGCESFPMREDGPRSESSFYDLQADGRGAPYWPNNELVKVYRDVSLEGEEGILALYREGINFLGNNGNSAVIEYGEIKDVEARDRAFGKDNILISAEKRQYNFKINWEGDIGDFETYLESRAGIND